MLPTIYAAAEAIRKGALSPVELVEKCLDAVDRYEPRVRAWVLIDRVGARKEAEHLEKAARRGEWLGSLHGIPVGIKDIIDVEGWATAAGSRLWANKVAARDACVVTRLRQAGAILLGKTVTTPYASFDPPPTRNPWNITRTPGGSSSGSAAAVACGMCLGALGSQTGGSLTRPASYCGVATCKPSFGRVSVDGVLPLAPNMDHVGPIARCVHDLGILLDVIANPEDRGPGTCEPLPNKSHAPTAERWPVPRLGRLGGLFDDLADESSRAVVERATERFRCRGASVVKVAPPSSFAAVLERHRIVMAVEAAAFHEARLREHPDDYGPRITALLEEGLACPAPEYVRTREHQRRLTLEFSTCFEGVDALLTLATTSPAPPAETTGDPAFNSPWSYTGFPTVSLPAGWSSDGLPLAIQLVGRTGAEADLLATAAWCETVLDFDFREPPTSQ
jgi:Asp-tRNA(Asn)/Glu-tRNA(Gln) amidotransferase A subunit family amidase